jgi:hypothetical protein
VNWYDAKKQPATGVSTFRMFLFEEVRWMYHSLGKMKEAMIILVNLELLIHSIQWYKIEY